MSNRGNMPSGSIGAVLEQIGHSACSPMSDCDHRDEQNGTDDCRTLEVYKECVLRCRLNSARKRMEAGGEEPA